MIITIIFFSQCDREKGGKEEREEDIAKQR